MSVLHRIQALSGGLLIMTGLSGAFAEIFYPQVSWFRDAMWQTVGLLLIPFMISCLLIWYTDRYRR